MLLEDFTCTSPSVQNPLSSVFKVLLPTAWREGGLISFRICVPNLTILLSSPLSALFVGQDDYTILWFFFDEDFPALAKKSRLAIIPSP